LSNIRSEAETKELHRKILTAATAHFMQKGFERTTVMDISKLSGIPKSKILYEFSSKEEILGLLVTRFLDGVTAASDAVSKKLTDDQVLIFIANEVLQIYMAEMNEDMRNLYLSGYSMPKTSEEVLKRRTNMMYEAFKEIFQDFAMKDFYETEIASMGIMRAYMTVPCDMYFTMERKIRSFLQTTFLVYEVPQAKIDEAIAFVGRFDLKKVAEETIEQMLKYLESKT